MIFIEFNHLIEQFIVVLRKSGSIPIILKTCAKKTDAVEYAKRIMSSEV